MMPKNKKRGFGCMQNKGFHITFENGITVSVQFGPENYCERNDLMSAFDIMAPMKQKDEVWFSGNAEVGIWDRDGKWILEEQVVGYLTPEEVLKFLIWAEGGCKGAVPKNLERTPPDDMEEFIERVREKVKRMGKP